MEVRRIDWPTHYKRVNIIYFISKHELKSTRFCQCYIFESHLRMGLTHYPRISRKVIKTIAGIIHS